MLLLGINIYCLYVIYWYDYFIFIFINISMVCLKKLSTLNIKVTVVVQPEPLLAAFLVLNKTEKLFSVE